MKKRCFLPNVLIVIGAMAFVVVVVAWYEQKIPQIDAVIVEPIFYTKDSAKYFVKDRRECAYVYPYKYSDDTTSDGHPLRALHSDFLEPDRGFFTEDSAKWWLREYLFPSN